MASGYSSKIARTTFSSASWSGSPPNPSTMTCIAIPPSGSRGALYAMKALRRTGVRYVGATEGRAYSVFKRNAHDSTGAGGAQSGYGGLAPRGLGGPWRAQEQRLQHQPRLGVLLEVATRFADRPHELGHGGAAVPCRV